MKFSPRMKDINDFLLTSNVTVGQTRKWMTNKDDDAKSKLIELVRHRFYNRYLKHIECIDSGFLMMAVSCLMIETIESFRQGLRDTSGRGVGLQMFKDFFEVEQMLFPGFNSISKYFYANIRCGILHQAETTNAWRILRDDSPILNKDERTINSKKFVNALGGALDNYIEQLKANDFNSAIWKNVLLKLDDICENCNIQN